MRSASRSTRPLPPTITRPSGRRKPTEWYRRPCASLASVVHCSVAGDHSSAESAALEKLVPERFVSPPVASTLPSGSVVRLRNDRPCVIESTWRHAGDPDVMSRTYAVFSEGIAGAPPSDAFPALRIFPGRYIVEEPAS